MGFPKINENQIVISLCEKDTGIVLDSNYKYVINQERESYFPFDNLEEAKEKAFEYIKKAPFPIQVYFYNSNNKTVLFLE